MRSAYASKIPRRPGLEAAYAGGKGWWWGRAGGRGVVAQIGPYLHEVVPVIPVVRRVVEGAVGARSAEGPAARGLALASAGHERFRHEAEEPEGGEG
jgi:hypothetical protein